MPESIRAILMRRDGDSQAEAQARIDECKELIINAAASGRMWECDRIIEEELGLEPEHLLELFPMGSIP